MPYQPGTLRAEGKMDGKTVCVKEVRTARLLHKIKLSHLMNEFISEEEILPLVADGRDIVIIQATIVDEENNLVPTAENLVHFSAAGEGKIIGVGNGNLTSHEANKATSRLAYNGLCAVIIQSTKTPGEGIVRAEAVGLLPAEIIIRSVLPVPVLVAGFVQPYSISAVGETSFITAEIRDKFGAVIPISHQRLTFQVEGSAKFENDANIVVSPVINGIAKTSIKAYNKNEVIRVTAGLGSLIPAKIDIRVE